jgi:replicative DNA helicase
VSYDLLSVLAERDHYYRYQKYIKPETLSEEVRLIVKDLSSYYKDYASVDTVNWETFSEWWRIVAHSSFKQDKQDRYQAVFDRMKEYSSTELATTIVNKYMKQDYCQQIADISLRGAEGDSVDISDIEEILDEYKQESGLATSLDAAIVTSSMEELLEEHQSSGFDWPVRCLNKSVGRVGAGDLVCVAMRPNTGKTTFLCSAITTIAKQIEEDETILWFANEEKPTKVMRRLLSAATGLTIQELEADYGNAQKVYEKAICGPMGKIKVVKAHGMGHKELETYIKNYKPKAVVVDQLWKVKGFEKSAGTDTERLRRLFEWGREMAAIYECPFIVTHQVKTEGHGVEYLDSSMLYLSGTGIQGEVDVLLLLGRNFHAGQEHLRFLSIGKVKETSGPDVDPTLSEGKFILELDAARAQWRESE